MKKLLGVLILGAGLAQASCATTTVERQAASEGLEHVSRISSLSGLYSWNRVDDDTVILWASASRPYLVDLSRKARDLRFATAIAVTSTAGSIEEKFDSVIVDGIPYQIAGIYKLDRATARMVERGS